MVQFLAFTHCKGSKHSPFFLHAQGFIQDFPFGGGGGGGGKSRGVVDKHL